MQGFRSVGPAVGYQADEWSTATAREMIDAGSDDGTVIRYLEAYGLSTFAAQALVRRTRDDALLDDFNYVGSRHHY